MSPVETTQSTHILVRVVKYDATPNGTVPTGSLMLNPKSVLSNIRHQLEHPQRLYMDTNDIFYLCPSHSLSQWCPIAKIDETSIEVADYLAQSNVDNIYVGRAQPPAYNDQKISDPDGATIALIDPDLITVLPSVLHCWGTANNGRTDQKEAVTSYTVTRLPNFSLAQNGTLAAFARSPQKGQRIIFSIESPFYEKSILDIGTCTESREIQANSFLVGEDGANVKTGVDVEIDGWTHVAIVWDIVHYALRVYVNGTLSRATILGRPEKLEFLKTIGELHLVLGRGKTNGKTQLGWDGEITDARVWRRALTEDEMKKVAQQVPAPLNPNLPKIWNDRKC